MAINAASLPPAPGLVLGELQRADGSCRLTCGAVSVLCGVLGPAEARRKNEVVDRAYVEVIVQPQDGSSGVYERLTEQLIRETVSAALLAALHPRTAVTVSLQVLAGCNGTSAQILATCVNAAYLAMVDAGLTLDRQLAAMTVLADKDERLVVINGEEVVSAVSVEETSDCPIYTVVVGWNPRRSVAYSERDGALACSLDASGTADAPDATDDDRMTIVALHGNGALTAEQERQLFGGNEPDDTWQMVKAGARRVAAQLRIAVERQVDAER